MDLPNTVDEKIWAKVRTAFAEALGLDEDEIAYDSKVIGDLGAESLDFLDIAFRLERAFDIKIPRGGIEKTAQTSMGDEPYEVAGVLTPLALQKLADAMPEIPREEFKEGLRTSEVAKLFRVATFYNLVVHLMAEKAQGA